MHRPEKYHVCFNELPTDTIVTFTYAVKFIFRIKWNCIHSVFLLSECFLLGLNSLGLPCSLEILSSAFVGSISKGLWHEQAKWIVVREASVESSQSSEPTGSCYFHKNGKNSTATPMSLLLAPAWHNILEKGQGVSANINLTCLASSWEYCWGQYWECHTESLEQSDVLK